jgi:hypothetical protein
VEETLSKGKEVPLWSLHRILKRKLKMLQIKKISTLLATILVSTIVLTPIASAAVPTTLTTSQKAQLKFLVEEEKMARDVYTYLSTKVTTRKFSNIARSEQTHMNYMTTLLAKYKVWNPTTNRKAGVFFNKEIQALYNSFIVEGAVGLVEAYGVGVKVEEHDIATIEKMLLDNMPVDMKAVLELLLAASYNHLEAFTY